VSEPGVYAVQPGRGSRGIPTGEVYITESCIGCGILRGNAAPYGAISIVQIEDEAAERSSWQHFSEFFSLKARAKSAPRKNLACSKRGRRQAGTMPHPARSISPSRATATDELRKKVAIKCDLCAGYSDQACVQACPTGAAIRIQPTKFFGSTEEILAAGACAK